MGVSSSWKRHLRPNGPRSTEAMPGMWRDGRKEGALAERGRNGVKVSDWGPKQIALEVRRMDPKIKRGTDEWIAANVLIAALVVGPYQRLIAKKLLCRQEVIRRFVQNLRVGGIFKNGKVSSDVLDGIGFSLGIAVAMGWIRRVRSKAGAP